MIVKTMSDPSSFLLSSGSPTESYHNFGVGQDDDAAENYPMESLENTNLQMVNPATRAFSTYLELGNMIKRKDTIVVRLRSRWSPHRPIL
jgi:hypothetical protein